MRTAGGKVHSSMKMGTHKGEPIKGRSPGRNLEKPPRQVLSSPTALDEILETREQVLKKHKDLVKSNETRLLDDLEHSNTMESIIRKLVKT